MEDIDKKDVLKAFTVALLAFPIVALVGGVLHLSLLILETILWR